MHGRPSLFLFVLWMWHVVTAMIIGQDQRKYMELFIVLTYVHRHSRITEGSPVVPRNKSKQQPIMAILYVYQLDERPGVQRKGSRPHMSLKT